MTDPAQRSGSDLFVVDNSDSNWKVLNYLREWTEIAHTFDIATGYFEIGALIGLDGYWQKLDHLRILMGDEVTKRTRRAIQEGLDRIKENLDGSIERAKEANDFLRGVPAIVDAIANGKVLVRAYTKDRFHAKAYITHAKLAVVGSSALVGSSNFTYPGLTDNVELNIQLRREVELLQEWFERHWNQAQDITPEILRVIERHTREYSPFEVYARALQLLLQGHELTAGEWELTQSRMFPVLDHYQKEGYQALMKISRQHRGAFLCDGVGLGKTFIGLMAIERLTQYEKKNVVLFVPKAARAPVWEAKIRKYLPELFGGDFSRLVVLNHTDLGRGGEFPERLTNLKLKADVVVIDEAHHFRNLGQKDKSRYWHMADFCTGKTVLLLTATPINNSLLDLQHMIELFTGREPGYFKAAPLGIHSLPGHFRTLEKALEKLLGIGRDDNGAEVNLTEAEKVLANDELFRALVVQRSRAYVQASQERHDGRMALFPKREDPKVVSYSIKKTYGRLLGMVETAFAKKVPLFSLAIYYPLYYYKGSDTSIDPKEQNRQRQVVGLIRTLFLKRFESSARAFEASCETLLLKLLTFATRNSLTDGEKSRLERWEGQNAETIRRVHKHQHEKGGSEPEESDEDVVSDEMLESVGPLSRDEYKVEEILQETFLDLDQVVEFLRELAKFKPKHDDKLAALIRLLKNDKRLKEHKLLIFSEYMDTARYVATELRDAGIDGIDEVDSGVNRDRGDIISQFSPYYNESSTVQLAEAGLTETRILISTDVLSEGLNLQDATLLVNYDLHWNPVRLMQRIGRVDRRLEAEVEEQICADHPERAPVRRTVAFWNFLPPEELDSLLRLYQLVSHKTLKISKTFGIEGKKLLTPEDDYDALREFNHEYEGSPSFFEKLRLELQDFVKADTSLAGRLTLLPGRVFSGRQHPTAGTRAVFFCFGLPALDKVAGEFTEEAGTTRWYLHDLDRDTILEEPNEIVASIRSKPDTPRHCSIEQATLVEIRAKIEKHIKNTYLKRVDAPVGVKPTLKCWMELNEG
jgi:superfamily II DNA or RNA helicase